MKTWIPDARDFAYLTWKQVDALSRDSTLLVLPTAAIEQHGGHLPLATDTLINNLLLGKAPRPSPRGVACLRAPARLLRQKQRTHRGFPGTLSVRAGTFMAVVTLQISGASIASAGFKKLVIFNTHGGNTSLVDVLARDLRAEFGLRTFSLFGSSGAAFERHQRAGANLRLPRRRNRKPPICCTRLRSSFILRSTFGQLHRPRRTARGDQARRVLRPTSPGLHATSKLPAACWATLPRQPRKRVNAGPTRQPPASPSF